MSLIKVFGPPGTGKTTFLLDCVAKLIEDGVSVPHIGYFAFTKKAAYEARDRAIDRFDFLQKTDFGNFRTLHSLAYARLALSPDKVLKEKQLREFSQKMGIEVQLQSGDETGDVRASNPALDVYNLARLRCLHPKIEYDRSNLQMSWRNFEYIYRSYEEFLIENDVHDYTMLLEKFATAEESYYPRLSAVFIDEAQDLNMLQWEIVRKLVQHSDRSWVAGDDDQAIYGFAGADVEKFLQLEGEQVILDRSYRVPKEVHEYANRIIERVKYRIEKHWAPNEKSGQVNYVSSIYDFAFKDEGTWLILSATNYMLNEPHEHLKSLGLLFERNHVRSISEGTVEAVYAWEQLRKGKEVSASEARSIFALLDARFVKHGFRKFKGPEDTLYSVQDLISLYGLVADHFTAATDLPEWFEALSKISSDKITYIKAALRRGQSLRGNPRIKLSTIHGAKGGEADNVIVLSDLSNKFVEEAHRNPDAMRRLLYVAVTRSKKNLFLVAPKDVGRAFHI